MFHIWSGTENQRGAEMGDLSQLETSETAKDIPGINITDLDAYRDSGVPHDQLRTIREQDPVYFHREDPGGGNGFWALTKPEDICFVSRNPQLFSSSRGGTTMEEYEPEDLSQFNILMLNMDPPQHAKYRKLVSKGFTPRIIRSMAKGIAEDVDEIINDVIEKGSCDFVRDIAAELPLVVIARLLGVPKDERDKLFDWSNRLIGFDDPEFQTSIEDARMASMEIWMYANSLAEAKLASPESADEQDIIRTLMNAEVDGEKLTEMEFDAFFLLLAVAGNETTRNAISGGIVAFFENPDQWQRLVDNPDLVDSAIEEILRWVTPVMYFRRTATQDVEIGGKLIREGEKVLMYYNAANRDDERFADAQKFDIARTENDHVTFGHGEHFCLGASLARLEMKLLFAELIKRMPDIRLAGDIRRLRSNFINGYKEIPVEFTPGAKI